MQHRFSQSFSTQVAYTLSHLKDSTTGPFYYPNNQFNLAGEWGPSPDNQTNTLTVAGTYTVKWGIASQRSAPLRIGPEFPGAVERDSFGAVRSRRQSPVPQHDALLRSGHRA